MSRGGVAYGIMVTICSLARTYIMIIGHWDESWPATEPRPVAWNCSAESRADHHGTHFFRTHPPLGVLHPCMGAMSTDTIHAVLVRCPHTYHYSVLLCCAIIGL